MTRERVPVRVGGIPCLAEVTHYLHVPPYRGPASYCDCPDDLYGCTEIEFNVLDRNGRPAAWLEKKLTDAERQRVEAEILDCMKEPA